MHYLKALIARQAFPAERSQRFPALLLESGSAQLPLKQRLQAFLFRNGYFDIYDSVLSLPGLKARYPTTVSTPEDLSREGRKKVVAAIQQMVEQGEATLRGLIDSKIILPQAPIGYWEEKENALFWIDQLVDRKIDALLLPTRAREVVKQFREGKELNFFERLVYQEAKREAICSLCERDFIESDLYGMFQDRYGTRVFPLVLDLYPGFGINIWETNSKGLTKYFSINENQVLATRWLVKQFHKKFRDFTEKQAHAYELLKTNPEALTREDRKVLSRLQVGKEKDPLTLTITDYCKKRLKRLIYQIPPPFIVAKAVCMAFPERGYNLNQFKTVMNFRASEKNKALEKETRIALENGKSAMLLHLDLVSRGYFFITTKALGVPGMLGTLSRNDRKMLLGKPAGEWHVGELRDASKLSMRNHIIDEAQRGNGEQFIKSQSVLTYAPSEFWTDERLVWLSRALASELGKQYSSLTRQEFEAIGANSAYSHYREMFRRRMEEKKSRGAQGIPE